MTVVTALLTLSLLAKSMWVTFPFLLLLLDFWPLRRHDRGRLRLVAEKLPLFALAVVSCAITMHTQVIDHSAGVEENIPFLFRAGNAAVSYVQYLRQTFWPTDLAALYPHPGRDLNNEIAVAAFAATCDLGGPVGTSA